MAVSCHCGYRPITMRRTLHRAVALLAAYAVALQALLVLAAAAPRTLSPGASSAICRADDGGAPAAPAHDKCDACLAGHCAGAAGKMERTAFAAPWRTVSVAPMTRHRTACEARVPDLRAHGQRAPPCG
jgi:hypothetical protein